MDYLPGHEPEGPEDHDWEITMTVTWTATVAAASEEAALEKLWAIESTDLEYSGPEGAEEDYSSSLADMGPSYSPREKAEFFPEVETLLEES